MIPFMFIYIGSAIVSIALLPLFQFPILFPILFSGLLLFFIVSILLLLMTRISLQHLEKDKIGNFKILKKVYLTFQLSVSILLLFIAMNIFQDINKKVSPYRNYTSMDSAWALTANDYEPFLPQEKYSKQKGPLVNKTAHLYEKYPNKMMLCFTDIFENKKLGNILYANKAIFDANFINTTALDKYINTNKIPLILSHRFAKQYVQGDVIKGDNLDYVVARILNQNETLEILGPSDYATRSSDDFAFGLINEKTLPKVIVFKIKDATIVNTNFTNTLYYKNISKTEMKNINQYLNQGSITYQLSSIKGIQEDYYQQKLSTVAGYFLVGSMNLLFSVIGLLYVLLLEIQVKALVYAIMKLVGSSSKSIYIKYMLSIVIIFAISLCIGFAIAQLTLGVSMFTLGISLALMLVLLVIVSYFAFNTIKKINPVKEIGGINV